MSRRVIPATRAEVAALLARRREVFPGFVPDLARQAAGAVQLARDFGEGPLRGELLSDAQLVASAQAHADAREADLAELEREVQRRTPMRERFADYPSVLRMLGLSQTSPELPAEHPAEAVDRAELGEHMRRVLRGGL